MILETTQYGTFCHVRTVDTINADTVATTPMHYGHAKPAALMADLLATGEANHGWTRWEVMA